MVRLKNDSTGANNDEITSHWFWLPAELYRHGRHSPLHRAN